MTRVKSIYRRHLVECSVSIFFVSFAGEYTFISCFAVMVISAVMYLRLKLIILI